MGIKYNKLLHLVFIIGIASCSSPKEIDSYKLCEEFYQLNKDKDLNGLFDISIGVRRVRGVYDNSLNQYNLTFNTIEVFDSLTQKYITLPVFQRNAALTEKDSVFRRIAPEVKSFLIRKLNLPSETVLFNSYVEFIDLVYQKYYNIETPKSYSLKNVVLEGYSHDGKFISFSLREGVNVYYLADRNSLTEHWKTYFDNLKKFDDNWFYEIEKVKPSK